MSAGLVALGGYVGTMNEFRETENLDFLKNIKQIISVFNGLRYS